MSMFRPTSPILARLAWACALACASAAAVAGNRPFPQHVSYTAGVIKPTHVTQAQMDQSVRNLYTAWKSSYLRSDGGDGSWIKYDNTNSTVSEAHGYGMVLAAYMDDQAVFDEMLRYFRNHPTDQSADLMAWKQTLQGGKMVDVEGRDSATDGDLDVAYSLLLAHVQWGSGGSHDYLAEARKVMSAILKFDVNPKKNNLTVGSWVSGTDRKYTRPSDFMASHILAFARWDSANSARWDAVHQSIIKAVNDQFTHGSQDTGIVPDFMVLKNGLWKPVPGKWLETQHDGDYSYNACRTPWRLAMSYIVDGHTGLLASQQKTASWIRTKTNGVATNVDAGYYVLNGTNGESFRSYDDLPFTAPMAVNAMLGGAAAQTWLNSLWTSINGGDYGTTTGYYGDAIRLQVMLTVSGNWWRP
ncbi:glycosyl hydrolase family 8 [Ideonella sp. DXS29W]|uniref:cellulase n=1 Tax=Ideonella lacteola TaxID=2984193 RepID=A0ABU9BP91_9BURK